jgi:hypothetical protein
VELITTQAVVVEVFLRDTEHLVITTMVHQVAVGLAAAVD